MPREGRSRAQVPAPRSSCRGVRAVALDAASIPLAGAPTSIGTPSAASALAPGSSQGTCIWWEPVVALLYRLFSEDTQQFPPPHGLLPGVCFGL
jgi:hypothetical protein